MFNFPFASLINGSDPFDPYDYPLPAYYDPSPFLPPQTLIPKQEEVPKVEEPTSPGYAPQDEKEEAPQAVLEQQQQSEEQEERTVKLEKTIRPEKSKKIVKEEVDDDYKPYRRTGRPTKTAVKQKQDRNLIPNTVHHLLAFVQKQFKSNYLVEQMLPAMRPSDSYTIPRYYNFHRMLRAEINNYVNEEAIRTISHPGTLPTHEYGIEEQEFYCRLSRVVARRFLKVEAVLMILRSKKVRRDNILEHLSVQRYLYENMRAFTRS